MSFSALVIPTFVIAAGALMFFQPSGFDAFIRGAENGLKTAVSILPTMLALTVSLTMLTASGGAELLCALATPVCTVIGVPPEAVPLIVTRPFSGSAASAAFAELIKTYGPDSAAGLAASVIMGSSDTLVYVMAVYFGKTRVRHATRAFVISAVTSILGVFLSCALVRIFF